MKQNSLYKKAQSVLSTQFT